MPIAKTVYRSITLKNQEIEVKEIYENYRLSVIKIFVNSKVTFEQHIDPHATIEDLAPIRVALELKVGALERDQNL